MITCNMRHTQHVVTTATGSFLFLYCTRACCIVLQWNHPLCTAAHLALRPCSSWYLLMMSLSTLFKAWPMCRSPLA